MAQHYPAECALRHRNAYELLVATILSAQCTDERVNQVTPAFFDAYPTPEDLAHADPEEVEALIRPTGFFRSKARNLVTMATQLVELHGGEVPESMEDLTRLAGVGRKTANVVRSVWFRLPGLPVDTHVARLCRRLELTKSSDPDGIERELCAVLPPEDWGPFSLRMIQHGRTVCTARKPACHTCFLNDFCPSATMIAS